MWKRNEEWNTNRGYGEINLVEIEVYIDRSWRYEYNK